ncbi:MAG: aldo/keto reductase [Chlorobi bacterium CHB2]|nr:aldo/keto reductase [Chlorobi bacterium CHB2]
MRATESATRSYFQRFPELPPTQFGRTGLMVSRAGFGGYRVSAGIAGHHAALRGALLSGINLLDTSANYADGGSEELIGQTLHELFAEGAVRRQEVVVVTKAGYIQGSNFEMATEREAAGSGFPDVVRYGNGLWHCIAPEFLHDQLTRSLQRLNLPAVDVLLLHNPEYYLGWAAKHGVPLPDARREYYRRIQDAFAYLETEVEQGRIGWYGISSNSFPSLPDADDFTSLQEVINVANRVSLVNHFGVIQFPANLYERGFVATPNQPDGSTLIQLAHQRNLATLANRPLNAIQPEGLLRLADFPTERHVSPQEILHALDQLEAMERDQDLFTAQAANPDAHEGLGQVLIISLLLREHWEGFGSIERYNDIRSHHFAPRLWYIKQQSLAHPDDPLGEFLEGYVEQARAALALIGDHYSQQAQLRSDRLRTAIGNATATEPDGSLSSLSLRLLLSVPGIHSVLVGMRRLEYVEDVLQAIHNGEFGGEEALKKLLV